MENNTLTAKRVADAAYDAIRAAAVGLREDVLCGLAAARKIEEQPRAQSVLDCLLENAQIAREDGTVRRYSLEWIDASEVRSGRDTLGVYVGEGGGFYQRMGEPEFPPQPEEAPGEWG